MRIVIAADRFLRHMVPMMAGTLIRVGLGRLTPEAPGEFLGDPDKPADRPDRAGARPLPRPGRLLSPLISEPVASLQRAGRTRRVGGLP